MDDLDLFSALADGTLGRRTAPAMGIAVDRGHLSLVSLAAKMGREAARPLDPIGEATQAAVDAACTIYVTLGTETLTGSGFLIGDGIVLTNSHVIPSDPSASGVTVSFDGQNAMHAEVVAVSDEVDAAALRVPGTEGVPAVEISPEECRPGEIIAVIGSPEGWQDVVTVGRVSAVDRSPSGGDVGEPWSEMMFVDADILEGSSGSMVIDIQGRVVGMVMGVIGRYAQDRGVGQNAVIPIRRVLEGLGL